MRWHIIMLLSIIWLAPLICLLLNRETKFKNDLATGVTFPYAAQKDAEVTARLALCRKQLLWVCLLLLALAVPCVFVKSFGAYMSLWCLWIIVCIIAPFAVFALCNRDLKRIKRRRGWVDYGEDDKWIWGIFYYAPGDRRNLVSDRAGFNTTFNMARPAGKICMGLAALLLLAMPFIGPVTELASARPITLELTETELVAACGKTQYAVPLEDIRSAELLEALPEKLVRKNGTGMENLLKGHFSADGIGKILVCLDPRCGPFILISTASGQHYLFGTRTADVTAAVFEGLK